MIQFDKRDETIMTTELAKRLREKVFNEYKSGEKLAPERHLAKEFNTTHSRIHRAIQLLVKEGLLVTKVGDGTYVTEKIREQEVRNPFSGEISDLDREMLGAVQTTFRVNVINCDDFYMRTVWEEIFRSFTEECPFLRIESSFGDAGSEQFDVWIIGIHNTFREQAHLIEIDEDALAHYGFSFNSINPAYRKLMSYPGRLCLLPLLRIPSTLFVNMRLLEKSRFSPEDIASSVNIFSIAAELEKKLGVHGMAYRGYHWHGCHYGMYAEEKDNHIEFDPPRLRSLLIDAAQYVKRENFLFERQPGYFEQGLQVFQHNSLQPRLPDMSKMGIIRISPAMARDGFMPESMICGAIPVGSRRPDEALIFLAFLESLKTQSFLAEKFPEWLPIHETLLKQKKYLSAPAIDLRSYYSFFSKRVYCDFGPMINVEAAKFFLNIQDIDTTMEKLRKAAGSLRQTR